MMETTAPFEFKQYVSILKSTGRRAGTLRELRESIAAVSGESLFHHTYQYFLKGHVLEYTNDFAHWTGEGLEERALAEHLSNIDPYDYGDSDALRVALLAVIDYYLEHFPEPRAALPGAEFYFSETVSFVFSSGIRARNLAEFLIALRYIDPSAIYYHFYEARVRLGMDDFSSWVETALDRKELAERIRAIDPFMHSIEGIREHIVEVIDDGVRKGMEVL
jgi:hypothetical protein